MSYFIYNKINKLYKKKKDKNDITLSVVNVTKYSKKHTVYI